MKKFIPLLFLLCFTNISFGQWTDLNTPIQGELNSVFFFHPDTGIVVGDSGIYKTNDGGVSWIEEKILNNPTDSNLLEMSRLNSAYFFNGIWYVVGKDSVNGDGVIFTSTQINNVWQLSDTVTGYGLNGVGKSRSSEVIVVGDNGTIVYTADNGNTWNSSNSSVNADLYCIHSNNSTSYIGGKYKLLAASNFISQGWSVINSQNIQDLYVRLTNQFEGVSYYDIVYGDIWTQHVNSKYNGLLKGKSISFNTDTESSIGTENGIYRSYNNLAYWEKIPSADGYFLNDIYFLFNTQVGYAVGPNGLVIKTSNLGGDALPYISFDISGGCVDSTINFLNNGPSTYSYTWKIDGNVVSNLFNEDTVFNTIGSHTVTLIASNGDLIDSLQIPFNIVNLPDTSKLISVTDSMLCKIDSSEIVIHQSENNVIYSLISVHNDSLVDEVQGNGLDVYLSTGLITDSTYYRIAVRSIFADCKSFFLDTILVGVEHTKAKFHPHLINADLNELTVFYNNSDQASFFDWTFSSGASSSSSTLVEPNISFNQLGQSQASLIATSLYGCKDTLTKNASLIYDSQSINDNCWAQRTTEYERAFCVKATEDNGVLVAGEYARGIFPSKVGNTSDSYGELGFYMVKYDPKGVIKWMVRSERWHTHVHSAFDIETDSDGNIYLVGTAGDNYWLYSNNGDSTFIEFPNHPNTSAFIIKYNSNGVFQWISKIGGPSATTIAIDDSSNVYVTGPGSTYNTFWSSNDSIFPSPSASPNYDGTYFILKMDSSGIIKWITDVGNGNIGWNFDNIIRDMAVDPQGNIVITGQYETVAYFGSVNLPDVSIPHANSSSGAYVVKYSSSGDVQWSHRVHSVAAGVISDAGYGAVMDDDGNSYIIFTVEAGHPGDYAEFPSVSAATVQVAAGSYVLVSYDKYGNFRWGTGSQWSGGVPYSLSIDKQNNLYVVSQLWDGFYTSVDFLSTDTIQKTMPLNNGSFFISKYGNNGKLKWVTMESGLTSSNSGNSTPYDVSVNSLNEVFVVGKLDASNYVIASETLTSTGVNGNAFIAKFSSSGCLQPDLIVASPPAGPLCVGTTIEVPFLTNQNISLQVGNTYNLELSDSIGSFSNPMVIGTLNSLNNLDTITGIIPSVVLGGNYFIRIVSTLPATIGNELPIFIDSLIQPQFINQELCIGDTLQLSASSGINYLWNPSDWLNDTLIQNPTTSTDSSIQYTVSVSTLCGNISDTFNVTVNTLPIVTIGAFNPDTLCDNGNLISLPVGTPSGGNYSGTGVGGGNFNPASAGVGTHNVIYSYTDTNTCINNDTAIVTVKICVGVDEVVNDFGILIYPNPNTGLFTIEKPIGLNDEVKVKLLDVTSKLIIDKIIPIGKKKIEVDITAYSKGMYYLQLIVGEEVFVKQILKD